MKKKTNSFLTPTFQFLSSIGDTCSLYMLMISNEMKDDDDVSNNLSESEDFRVFQLQRLAS